MAMRGVDVVIHAAALKQVPACEYNPFEAVKTNIHGAENVVAAAIDNDVPRTLSLSHRQGRQSRQPLRRHQAVRREDRHPGRTPTPATLRRASPRCATATWSAAAAASSRCSSGRPATGELTITDERMTRFWITLEQAVDFVISSLAPDARRRGVRAADPEHARAGDRRGASRPTRARRIIGIRPGEKVHEVLITEDESRHARVLDGPLRHLPAVALLDDPQRAARRGAAAGLPLLQRQQRHLAGRGGHPRDGRADSRGGLRPIRPGPHARRGEPASGCAPRAGSAGPRSTRARENARCSRAHRRRPAPALRRCPTRCGRP